MFLWRDKCMELPTLSFPEVTPLYWSLFFFFNWKLNTLQNCGSFCHIFTWISHRCTYVPHPEPSSHLLPHPIPLGCPSAPTLSALSHASNLDWWSISHMIIYMFQYYSLKSSHPRFLPQSPKDCEIQAVDWGVWLGRNWRWAPLIMIFESDYWDSMI